MYCLNLMRIALELAQHNRVYEDIATKFFEHFLYIAEAMTNIGERRASGCGTRGRVLLRRAAACRTDAMMPLQGALDGRADPAVRGRDARARAARRSCRSSSARLEWFLNYRPDLAALVSRWHEPGAGERRLLSLLRGHRMKTLLRRMLDETEFLSDYGVRALSQVPPATTRIVFDCDGIDARRRLRAGRVRHRPVRRQLQLARADLVPGQLPDHRVAAEVPSLLRRRLQGRVPDRLGPVHARSTRWPTNCRAA